MPKFTIRQLLFSIVIFAFVFAVLGWAVRGNIAAFGLGVAIFGLVIPFFVYACVYLLFSMLNSLSGSEPYKDLSVDGIPKHGNKVPSPVNSVASASTSDRQQDS